MKGYLTMIVWILLSVGVTIWMTISIRKTIRYLHILQLEGYKTQRFFKWLSGNVKRAVSLHELIVGVILLSLAALLYLIKTESQWIISFLAVWIATGLYLILKWKKMETKKRLAFTARAVRLLTLSLVFLCGIIAFLVLSFAKDHMWRILSLLTLVVGISMLSLFSSINISMANILITPLEKAINLGYLRSARKRIRHFKPRVIGITGSYGKTGTKDILSFILSAKYKVLKTPGSYNTPMGICKVVRGQLGHEQEIFVVEMGARNRGDIKELCDLVRPKIGILTAIGPQHLEMFKTMDSLIKTKYELIESLPPDGTAVLNGDDGYCNDLAEKTRIKVVRYGIEKLNNHKNLVASDISTDIHGINFTVRNMDGEETQFRAKLLGNHNVYNILAATAVALELGMSLTEISDRVKLLEPSPHRLQLVYGQGGVIVIDDSYNSNPVGAKTALEVLASFKNHRKILVTPGMVELGDEEYEQNRILGTEASNVCDIVLLVGVKRIQPILQGLTEAGFPEERIATFASLTEATGHLRKILRRGDVVLFENDLPDNYNEQI